MMPSHPWQHEVQLYQGDPQKHETFHIEPADTLRGEVSTCHRAPLGELISGFAINSAKQFPEIPAGVQIHLSPSGNKVGVFSLRTFLLGLI